MPNLQEANALMANVRKTVLPGKIQSPFPPGLQPPLAHLDLLDHVLDDAQDVPWVCALLDTLTLSTEE